MSDLSIFLPYLDQIRDATISNRMTWQRLNQNSYAWTTFEPQVAKIVVQKVFPPRTETIMFGGTPQPYFTFRAFEGSAQTPSVSLDSRGNDEISAAVEQLFSIVANSHDKKAADFLKSIIPPPF